ncbi:MAG: hypothetical protein ACJAU6_001348 [Alphaproteobacteria bacterium]|jgi:hypothetical protein
MTGRKLTHHGAQPAFSAVPKNGVTHLFAGSEANAHAIIAVITRKNLQNQASRRAGTPTPRRANEVRPPLQSIHSRPHRRDSELMRWFTPTGLYDRARDDGQERAVPLLSPYGYEIRGDVSEQAD